MNKTDKLYPIKKLIKVHNKIDDAYVLCLRYNLYFPTSSVFGLFFKSIEDMILEIAGNILNHKLKIIIINSKTEINRLHMI